MVNPAYLVGIGGAFGAVCRYLVDVAVPESIVPLGTLSVNVIGSFVLAFVTYLNPGGDVLLLVGTGACGSFTTFSSFSVATVGLWEEGSRRLSVAYAAANLIGALAAIALAWAVSGLVTA